MYAGMESRGLGQDPMPPAGSCRRAPSEHRRANNLKATRVLARHGGIQLTRTVFAALALVLILLAPALATATTPLPAPVDGTFVRTDPDGGRTLMLTLEDGVGGAYRHVPISDAGIAAHTNALEAQGVVLDGTLYGGDIKEIGGYVHTWQLAGTPYTTLGVYVKSASEGLLRLPLVILENVDDTDGAARYLAEVLGEDGLTAASAALPMVVGLTVPDSQATFLLGAGAFIIAAAAPLVATALIRGADDTREEANVPSEFYTFMTEFGGDAAFYGVYMMFAPSGYLGLYPLRPETYRDSPEVRVWTARRSTGAEEVWSGLYVSRTGHGGPDPETGATFAGTKRLETGAALRSAGQTHHAAGLYLEQRATRHNGPGSIHTEADYTVGVTAADGAADVPLARAHLEEARHDEGAGNGLSFHPDSQRDRASVGVMVGEDYRPLVGIETTNTHDKHEDVTNLGTPVWEIETERTTSIGTFVGDEYVPLVGARAWTERYPVDVYVLLFLLGLQGAGDQDVGDLETSVGIFDDGDYVPLGGARIDDDFTGHHHDYRWMVTAGAYPEGAYVPIVASTYDGQQPQLDWTLKHADGRAYARGDWQTSHGVVLERAYHPVAGVRFQAAVDDGHRFAQERYELGAYALDYKMFVPLAGLDYDGDQTTPAWIGAFANAMSGTPLQREGDWDANLAAYGPDGRTPLAGATYAGDSPDAQENHESHFTVGIGGGAGYTPLIGVTYAGAAGPVPQALALSDDPSGHGPRVSVGVYQGGAYLPLATVAYLT